MTLLRGQKTKQLYHIVNRMGNLINYLRLLAFTASLSYGYCRLNRVISYFETLDYEPMYKQFGRRVDERSIDDALFIDFKAFGRIFKLILSKDTSSNASDTEKMANYHKRVFLYPNSLVAGKRTDEKVSKIHGWITDTGLFYGTLKSQPQDISFYIEPAGKYFKKPDFHSVIYRSEDVGYGSQHIQLGLRSTKNGSRGRAHHKHKRRASTNPSVKITPKICRLSLEADYTFLEMLGSPLRAVTTMVSRIGALNKIFYESFISSDRLANESIFTLEGNDSVIKFQIARVRVYNETETSRVLAPGSLDAATFLRLMQQNEAYSKYCLALFFTARSFNEGVLGVANPGGVCTNSNVGVVSFTREGMVLPPLVTEIAVAHVVGHAFGAEHDEENCHPGVSKDGDFIMTRFGLNADQPNNFLYSPCSVQQIKSFVNTRQNMHCLEQDSPEESVCGNGVIEINEECDCGGEETCGVLEPGNCCDSKSCKLKAHAVCSVSNGFCCDGKTCNYKNAGDVCSPETECSDEAICPGNTSTCPHPSDKEKFLECNRNTSVCLKGVCSGKSVCAKFGLESCFCENKLDMCKICCLSKDKCWPAENITKIKSRLKSVHLSAGSLCANRQGYCDMFHECHLINLNAPFSHRYDPYFRKKGMKEITHSFWWAIFLGTVGLIALVVMIIKHGVLYTKSSCPELNEREPAKALPRLKLSRLKEEEKGIIVSDDMIA